MNKLLFNSSNIKSRVATVGNKNSTMDVKSVLKNTAPPSSNNKINNDEKESFINLKVENVTTSYGVFKISNIAFTLRSGDILGLVGGLGLVNQQLFRL